MRVYNLVKVYIAIVTFINISLRLYGTNDMLQLVQILSLYLSSLVEQDDVAELYLLNHERSQVFLVNMVFHQVVAPSKLIFHAQSIYHSHNTIKSQHTIFNILRTECRDRADGLYDRCRLADATCLNDDIVESLHIDNLSELFHEVHLQRTADTSILQGHERVVFLTDYAPLFDKSSIDVYLTDIIDDNSKLNTFFIR